ncbi:MAG: flagellar export chaperone FliS [Pirellulales bacterium]
MAPLTREAYLANQVEAASPQRLRVMLIEGAIRFGATARQNWEHDQDEQATESIIRCRSILAELMASASSDTSELGRRTVSLYVFLIRTLTEARRDRDPAKLNDVLDVLQIERETWLAVLEKLQSHSEDNGRTASVAQSDLSEHRSGTILPLDSPLPDDFAEGFSLEA